MPQCSTCGAALPAAMPGGQCPRCLIQAGFGAAPSADAEPEADLLSGRYRLGEKLGEGGFGVVYKAEQLKPVKRLVAIKLLKADHLSKQILARFDAERQALAMMEHPHIATILDAGEEDGAPFFVMEYVDGSQIVDFCETYNLDTRARLVLFTQMCEAVHYAHQKGIIHRDIKPSNIMVAQAQEGDGSPVCKVIDFGVAKAIDAPLTDRTYYTQMFQLVGTPAYMSPEQANTTQSRFIDTRSDVYSLGAILYELIAGSPPFTQQEISETPLDEMLRKVREDSPERPSTRLGGNTAPLRTTATKQLRGDLDWITMKALEKEPDRRYESAAALGMDVNRYLDGEGILARPPSKLYQMRVFARRNRAAVIGGSLAILALLVGTVVSSWQAVKAQKGETKFRELFYVANMNLVQQSWERNDWADVTKRLHDTVTYPDKGFEWHYWQGKAYSERDRYKHHGEVRDVATFSNGKRLIALDPYKAVIRDLESHQPIQVFKGLETAKNENHLVSTAVSPSGKQVVTSQHNGLLTFWDAATGQRSFMVEAGHRILKMVYAPDGQRLATTIEREVVLWDPATGEKKAVLAGHEAVVQAVAYSPDGLYLASGSMDLHAMVWEVATGKPLLRFRPHKEGNGVTVIAFSPDGEWVATGSWDQTARIWKRDTGEVIQVFEGHQAPVVSLAFSPSGDRLLTGSNDHTAKLWEITSGRELHTIMGHRGPISDVQFLAENEVLTASHDSTVAVWDLDDLINEGTQVRLQEGWVSSAVWGPDGDWFITGNGDSTASRWDAHTGERLQVYQTPHRQLWSLDVSADGQLLITGDLEICLWDVQSGEKLRSFEGHDHTIYALVFSQDGERFVSAGAEGTAKVWTTQGGTSDPVIFTGHTGQVTDATWHPDGKRVVSVGHDSKLHLWNAGTAMVLQTIEVNRGALCSMAVSPDGRYAVAGNRRGVASVWDLVTGEFVRNLTGHTERIWAIDFSPDGKRILTGAFDQTARLWNARNGEGLMVLRGHTAQIWSVAFSLDGLRVLTGGWDRTARVWDGFRYY